ncbi:stage V sporulation protein AA [Litchfieldia salsa]|uniref:Stage V sporulation protein AA n=1 Tax=Litchfieldia salsa TaxID=930152 RepID=A0A1H0WGI2_9BACI|nr:stage V sporulation protein AA [Litchfieldia salsa]SDP89889.1 stage V sporulation protein AA [Litchfieldia salsa]
MEKTIYVRLRHRIQVRPNQLVRMSDIAQIICNNEEQCKEIQNIPIYQITIQDKTIVVIDLMNVIKKVKIFDPEIDVQTIGPSQALIEIVFAKKKYPYLFFVLIWFLLFVGAALTIMNFHEDVSMQQVHQKLYEVITGEKEKQPLLLQVPYSIGLGLGMILFFNHIFKKRINEEPSPLEVEMFNYQQDLDNYLIINENKESIKKIDDP